MVVIFLNIIFWIIHVQSLQTFLNLCENLYSNVADVIFKFESPKRKAHKVHRNNAPSKIFKKYAFGTINLKKKPKIATHMDLWNYGQILTIQKFLIIND